MAGIQNEAGPQGIQYSFFNRRQVLAMLGSAGAGLLAAGVLHELGGNDDKPSALSSDIVEGISSKWRELSVFAGAVILGETTELSQDPGFGAQNKVDWPKSGKLLAVRRPVLVAESAGLNGFDQSEIDPTTLGFWLPASDDGENSLVFARYNRDRAFWPIYRGRYQGYEEGYTQLFGEAVRLSPNTEGARHFVVHRPEYDDKKSRTRVKDVGQSLALNPGNAADFLLDMSESYGGVEIRDWEPERYGSVEKDKYKNPLEIPERLSEKITEGLLHDWDHINVFGGVMAVSQATRVYSDPSLKEGTEVEWPQDYPHAVVVRPMFVVGSSLLNLEDAELEAVQQTVKRTTVGFFLPGPGRFVFMDTSDNAGNIIPMTRGFYQGQIKDDGLLGYDITLDGRETKGGVAYPYFKNKYVDVVKQAYVDSDGNYVDAVLQEKTRKALVAHSMGFSSGADAAAQLYTFFAEKWSEPLVLGN